jgi:hypothetical protein
MQSSAKAAILGIYKAKYKERMLCVKVLSDHLSVVSAPKSWTEF